MTHSLWMEMEDGTEVYVRKWGSELKSPKAMVQLSHGMVEHINRYNDFANYLVEQGIVVYGNDHRGHGKTGEKQGLLGYLSDKDGFQKTSDDLHVITNQMKREYPDKPLFLFGHSMGSFLARLYLQKHSKDIDGVILSGTGYFPTLTTAAGKAIASLLPLKKESTFMNNLAFGAYNKKIPSKRTPFDWLSRDEEVVNDYINDPLSGYIPTARFFFDLMTGLSMMQNNNNRFIRKDLSMLIISGDADPVGNYGKGIWKTAHLYEKAGLSNITTMLFPEARHELLNELNKADIYSAIYNWIMLNHPSYRLKTLDS